MRRPFQPIALAVVVFCCLLLPSKNSYSADPVLLDEWKLSNEAGFCCGIPPPSFMTFCLVYGFQDFPVDATLLISADIVLGCDQAFPPGESGFIDYTQSDDDFSAFVAKLTNGANDQIGACELSLGAGGARTAPSQCGIGPEHAILGRRPRNPDLKGRRPVDFIRLVVNKVELGFEPETEGWTFARWDAVWQFWSGTPRYPGGGERLPIDGLLTFSNPLVGTTKLPADSTQFDITVFYGAFIIPESFEATIDNEPLQVFNPVPNTSETVTIPLLPGRNTLRLKVSGDIDGRTRTDTDRFTFIVR